MPIPTQWLRIVFLKKNATKRSAAKGCAVTHALVTTCINYCNVLYMASLWRPLGLQLVQNSATWTLIGMWHLCFINCTGYKMVPGVIQSAYHNLFSPAWHRAPVSLMTTWLIQSDRVGALQVHLESIRILEACLHCHDTCPLEWDSPIFPMSLILAFQKSVLPGLG